MSIISVNDLCLWYGKQQALKDICVEIEPTARAHTACAAARGLTT